MDQDLLNNIISTSVGGAAGGAVAGIVVMAIQGLRAIWIDRRDANRAFKYLSAVLTENPASPLRATIAIAGCTDLTQDRVRFVCSKDGRIELKSRDGHEVWGIRTKG